MLVNQPSSHPPDSAQKRLVRVAFLGTPLYEQPDQASSKVAYLNKGTVMEVTREEGEFLQVQTIDGGIGYVAYSSVVAIGRGANLSGEDAQ